MSTGKHYDVCCRVAEFIKKKPWCGIKYVTVELVTQGCSNPDVWATNGWESFQVEVKMSRQDFIHDKTKFVRNNISYECGNHRYYCAPKGLISVDELPQGWGLIEFDEKFEFVYTKEAEYLHCDNRQELSILCSIMRREGIKSKIFNYRNNGKEKNN